MNSTQATEQILQAADTLIDIRLAGLKYDKTIQAEIVEPVDLDKGEYRVKYNSNTFSAYANDLKQSYKEGEQVYVSVPEGDFSNKKLIVSTVTTRSLSENQLTALQNTIFEKSPDFIKLYDNTYDKSQQNGVIAGAPTNSTHSEYYLYGSPTRVYSSDDYHGLFQQYANMYDLIKIDGSFLTLFNSLHDRGNYGIEVAFFAKNAEDTSDTVVYKLDVNAFNGDPYSFSTLSPQSIIIQIQKNYLLGIKYIRLFEENFEYDTMSYVDENGNTIISTNIDTPNIFAQDVEIKFVEKQDLSDSTYYLTIAAPRGMAFSNNNSSVELVGRLMHQGKDIMDSKTTCQWYERDLSVMAGGQDFRKEAGVGWRAIEKATPKTLSLDVSEVKYYEQKYKLVAVYNESTELSAEIEVFNLTNRYDYTIEQRTEGAEIKLQLTNNLTSDILYGVWYLSYPDGSYIQLQQGEKLNSIVVSEYLKYSSVTFYCTVFDSSKTLVVGTMEYTIMNSESDSDVTINYSGESSFRYDANGDITIEDSEKNRQLSISLTWKEGYGTAYTVEWLLRDIGGNLTAISKDGVNPTKPQQSMLEKLWVDNYNNLNYTIRQKYKINYQNNTVVVRIRTVSGETYLFDKEILFLKDGDQGTNGTTYVIAVRPYDPTTGLKKSGVQALEYNNGWKNTLPLRCYVYKDGEIISEGNERNNYDIEYTWVGINIDFNEGTDPKTDRVTAKGKNIITSSSTSAELEHYVKATVSIDDKMDNRKVTVVAYYPIDVAVGGLDASKVNIDSIPSYVKYTASGVSPQFYSKNLTYEYDGVEDNTFKSLNTSLLNIQTRMDDGLQYLKPASSFIAESIKSKNTSNVGLIQCGSSNYQYLIHPIIMYLDTYGNEAINGWDGMGVETGDGYVLAPQIGAGGKATDGSNLFTGVIMGKDTARDKIGLYGYQRGINTFGLTEDGKAYFGSRFSGAQIVIDGTTAEIYGGGQEPFGGTSTLYGGDSVGGMSLYLTDLQVNKDPSKSPAIKISKGIFQVNYDGSMTSTSGKIGGWNITSTRLSSGTGSNYVALDSGTGEYAIWAGSSNENSAKFRVKRDGTVYATGADISGKITVKEGEIGGWTIGNNYLRSSSGNTTLYSNGNITISGKLTASNADISGIVSTSDLRIKDKTTGQYTNILQASGNGQVIKARCIDLSDYTTTSGVQSLIQGEIDGLSLSVTNGQTSSTIRLTSGRVTLASQDITFNGMVTFNDLSGNGTTIINGNNITTGLVSADVIDARNIMSIGMGAISISGSQTAIQSMRLNAPSIGIQTTQITGSLYLANASDRAWIQIYGPSAAGSGRYDNAIALSCSTLYINNVSLDDYIKSVVG